MFTSSSIPCLHKWCSPYWLAVSMMMHLANVHWDFFLLHKLIEVLLTPDSASAAYCQFVALRVNSAAAALVSLSHATLVMKKTTKLGAAVSPSSKPGTQTSMHCIAFRHYHTNNNWASSVTSQSWYNTREKSPNLYLLKSICKFIFLPVALHCNVGNWISRERRGVIDRQHTYQLLLY